MHDVVVVASRINEREQNEKPNDGQSNGLRYVLFFQNLPCAPLANFLPNRPIGLSSNIKTKIIIP